MTIGTIGPSRSQFGCGPAALRPLAVGALALGLLVASQTEAHAYTYQSLIGVGCHERITMQSLRAVRLTLPLIQSVTPDANDEALIADLPYSLDEDMRDLTGATITMGVRDNDLKGSGASQLDSLAEVHGDPAHQLEHCLRAVEDDEPGGSQHALESCKTFMREKFNSALTGLDENGIPDPTKRLSLDVSLDLRGKVTATMPIFWVEIGRAMHALQDSFTHTFRSSDRMKVRTVLNWVEYVNKNEVESRDGPVHRDGLDQCEGLDDLRTLNLSVATQASTELLHAALDTSLTHDQKLARLDALFDRYMTYEPGCTADNGWCDAPEANYTVSAGCGCGANGGSDLGLAALFTGLGGGWLGRRRRGLGAAAGLGLVMLLSVGPAQAADAPPPEPPASGPATVVPDRGAKTDVKPDGTVTTPETTVVTPDPSKPQEKVSVGQPSSSEKKAAAVEEKHRTADFGLYLAVSGSVSNPAFNGQIGLRYHLSERWMLGLDAELNGWYGLQSRGLRPGAFNGYATVIFRTPLHYERVNLRTTANIGTSVSLLSLYGAPAGSVGVYFGLVPLGIEWKVSPSFYVVFDALGVALPVPQLTGVPFGYPQYRSALGIEYSL